jgi:hypothetical protein
MSERKLVQKVLIEHLRNPDVNMQKRAIDVITECLHMKACDEHYKLPVKNCPIAPNELVLCMIDGIPLYESDLRHDADTREMVCRRLTLHAEKRSPEPCINDVIMVTSMVNVEDILRRLTCVGEWEYAQGNITPRADSTVTYKLNNQSASRDFYADVTLSDDRRHITVEFR